MTAIEGRDPRSFTAAAAKLAGASALILGWRPDAFWRATPRELADIFGALAPAAAERLSRADLSRLMERFPDG